MDDDDFEKAVAELVETERKKARDKEPYYIESLEAERTAIVGVFNDHYESLSSLQGVETVEDLLAATDDGTNYFDDGLGGDDLSRNSLTLALDELIQEDIERVPALTSGEMHVGGEGVYMFEPDCEENNTDAQEFGCDILEDGAALIGDIGAYVVAPVIPYEAFRQTQEGSGFEGPLYDDIGTDIPGLWVILNNVKLYDGSGCEIGRRDHVLVPMEYPSLHFGKVMRQGESLKKADEVHVDVDVHFKGDFIREQFTIAENDLNYNDYSPEEHRECRHEHQSELGIYMSGVDPDEKLILSAFRSIAADGAERQLEEREAYYLEPVVIKPKGDWRVVHAFLVKNGDQMSIVYVLPEDLLAIRREFEK
ncbi:MAG TPA: hypothetical protein VN081_01535 [Dongiaceae bacterium]|nr:hypothetical protein [Dongiaceae bacterium]